MLDHYFCIIISILLLQNILPIAAQQNSGLLVVGKGRLHLDFLVKSLHLVREGGKGVFRIQSMSWTFLT